MVNIAPNANFELDPIATNTWFHYENKAAGETGYAVFSWATDAYVSYRHSLKIVSTYIKSSSWARWINRPLLSASPGKTYNANVQIKTDNSITTRFRLTFFSGSPGADTFLGGKDSGNITGTSGFVQKSVSAIAPSGTKYVRIEFMLFGRGASWFDNIFLEESGVTPSISVTSPNGSENWLVGSTHNITWSTVGSVGNVKIDLMKGGIFDRVIVSSVSGSSYSWSIPSGVASGNDYKIKVTSTTNSSVSDSSNSNFTISTPGITISSPNGGEDWQIGSEHNITWSSTGITGNVKIELVKGEVSSVVIASNASGTSYSWTVPLSQTIGADYKIRITSIADANITDISDSSFTISTTPSISITSPNGGETWKAGSIYNMLWSSLGTITNVKIELMKGGVLSSVIISSVSNTGSYSWTIPIGIVLGNDYKIKISNAADLSVSNISNGNFTIGPPVGTTIVLSSPNGGENWNAGESQTISWTSTGNPGNIKIELLKSNVVSIVIAESTGNIGLFSWTIPSSLVTSNEYRIRITSVYDSSVSDNSDNNFTINNLCPVPESDFTYVIDKLKSQFADASTNNPTGWSWNFGDNATSNEKNPVHTYVKEGTYTIVLTATNDCGIGTMKSKIISITIPPPSNFIRNAAIVGFGFAIAYFGYNAFKKPKTKPMR